MLSNTVFLNFSAALLKFICKMQKKLHLTCCLQSEYISVGLPDWQIRSNTASELSSILHPSKLAICCFVFDLCLKCTLNARNMPRVITLVALLDIINKQFQSVLVGFGSSIYTDLDKSVLYKEQLAIFSELYFNCSVMILKTGKQLHTMGIVQSLEGKTVQPNLGIKNLSFLEKHFLEITLYFGKDQRPTVSVGSICCLLILPFYRIPLKLHSFRVSPP